MEIVRKLTSCKFRMTIFVRHNQISLRNVRIPRAPLSLRIYRQHSGSVANVGVGPSKEARTPLRQCLSRSVLVAGRRTPPQEGGTTGAAWEGSSCYKLLNKGLEYSN